MATAGSFQIDQTVHGYARGHREVATSIELDDWSRATMIVMSDLLINSVLDDQASYLVCYPLPAAARHVLARTWSAGPEYRPGSVWTHSLLIDYRALAQIHDLGALADLLRRPTERLAGFEVPLSFAPTIGRPASRLDKSAARVGVAGVYSGAGRAVVRIPAFDDALNEALALALWRQAWPGLRRDFGFVTGSVERHSPIEAGCSLYFGNGHLQVPILDVGKEALFDDLAESGPTALRAFMSRYVVEAEEPRSAAPKVAQIWVEGEADAENGRAMILARLARSEGLPRLKRDLIACELRCATGTDGLVKLVDEFGDEPIVSLPEPVRLRVAGMAPEQIRSIVLKGSMATEGTLGLLVFHEVLSSAAPETLAEVADRSTRLLFLQVRPEMAFVGTFWPSSDLERAELIEGMPTKLASQATQLLELFGRSIGLHTAKALTSRILAENSSALLDLLASDHPAVRQAAAGALAADPGLVANCMADLRLGDFAALERIAEGVVTSGVDLGPATSWLDVIRQVSGRSESRFGSFSLTLVVAVALRVGGSAGFDLASVVFEQVLTVARRYSLGRVREHWLDRQLPASARGWSTSSRLVSSAVDVWPVQHGRAGALLLCRHYDNVRCIVDEVYLRGGDDALNAALHDRSLPHAASERINHKLHPRKLRFGFLGY